MPGRSRGSAPKAQPGKATPTATQTQSPAEASQPVQAAEKVPANPAAWKSNERIRSTLESMDGPSCDAQPMLVPLYGVPLGDRTKLADCAPKPVLAMMYGMPMPQAAKQQPQASPRSAQPSQDAAPRPVLAALYGVAMPASRSLQPMNVPMPEIQGEGCAPTPVVTPVYGIPASGE